MLPARALKTQDRDTFEQMKLSRRACLERDLIPCVNFICLGMRKMRRKALCTHAPRALEAKERQQGRAILSRAAPLTESAQLGGAPAADYVLVVKKLRCGRGAR